MFKPDKCRTVNYSEVKCGGGGGGIPAGHYGPSNTHSAQLGINLDRQVMGFLCDRGRGPY